MIWVWWPNVADRVVVMYAGKVIESGTVEEIFYRPRHPYTWGLMGSMPRLDLTREKELNPILGTPPDLFSATGLPLCRRCKHAMKICKQQMPESTSVEESRPTR